MTMKLKKVYLEISNVCNRSCAFCPGTTREAHFMDLEHFKIAAREVKTVSDFVYFHVMGEPLLHSELADMLDYCQSIGLKVIITTNGTLLKQKESVLLEAKALHKINISLHSFEANCKQQESYFEQCFSFAKKASECGKISVLRLWNLDGDLPGMNKENDRVISQMKDFFATEWQENTKGYRIANRLFLEWGSRFTWPDMNLPVLRENGSCYGLRDQAAILCDGTVVPCCLDKNGDIPLGNVFEAPLLQILCADRASSVKNGFLCGRYTEQLCKRCGYAGRFSTKN